MTFIKSLYFEDIKLRLKEGNLSEQVDKVLTITASTHGVYAGQ